jgi:hypothetical protein
MGVIILRVPVVNKDEVVLNGTTIGATLGLRSISEVGVCERPDER